VSFARQIVIEVGHERIERWLFGRGATERIYSVQGRLLSTHGFINQSWFRAVELLRGPMVHS
jgi:hypothetical protein